MSSLMDADAQTDSSCTITSFSHSAINSMSSMNTLLQGPGVGEEHEIDGIACLDAKRKQFVVKWSRPAPGESEYGWVNPSDINAAAWNAWNKKSSTWVSSPMIYIL